MFCFVYFFTEGQTVHRLIRVRNHLSNEAEIVGGISDKRSFGTSFTSEDLKCNLIGSLEEDCDGEVWMKFEDFVRKFDSISICNYRTLKIAAEFQGNFFTLFVDHKAQKV